VQKFKSVFNRTNDREIYVYTDEKEEYAASLFSRCYELANVQVTSAANFYI
jgi:hypothetical protein